MRADQLQELLKRDHDLSEKLEKIAESNHAVKAFLEFSNSVSIELGVGRLRVKNDSPRPEAFIRLYSTKIIRFPINEEIVRISEEVEDEHAIITLSASSLFGSAII